MRRLIRALCNRTPRKLKIDFYDRHAEHIDPTIPLCNHQSHVLYLGDAFHADVEMSITASLHSSGIIDGKAEFTIEFVEPGRIKIVVDMPDYIAARQAAKGA